jgi:hypothetical protein
MRRDMPTNSPPLQSACESSRRESLSRMETECVERVAAAEAESSTAPRVPRGRRGAIGGLRERRGRVGIRRMAR